jgi:bifunctional DNA-binding transcriptional regulator/antitoxin component of YhaV-PrlF toxin-antitoxin module
MQTLLLVVKVLRKLTDSRIMVYLYNMVKTKVSSKGQTTIPRKILKLWRTSQVLWDLNADGSARVAPTPDIMSLLGSAATRASRDPNEKKKIRDAIGRNAAQEGLSR